MCSAILMGVLPLNGQSIPPEKKIQVIENVHELIHNYQESLASYSNSDERDRFRGLFTPTAIIFDGISPNDTFHLRGRNARNVLKEVPLDVFEQRMTSTLRISSRGIKTFIPVLLFDYGSYEINGKIQAYLIQTVEAVVENDTPKYDEFYYEYSSTDTLIMEIVLSDDNTLRINQIHSANRGDGGWLAKCPLDIDFDGLENKKDPCPDDPENKCAFPDEVYGIFQIGYALTRTGMAQIPASRLSYGPEMRNIAIGETDFQTGRGLLVRGGGSYFFQKRWGVSLLLAFHRFNTISSLDTFQVSYKSGYGLGMDSTFYRRELDLIAMEETFRFTQLSLPLSLIYRPVYSDLWQVSISAGIHFSLLNGKSVGNLRMRYEGFHSFNPTTEKLDYHPDPSMDAYSIDANTQRSDANEFYSSRYNLAPDITFNAVDNLSPTSNFSDLKIQGFGFTGASISRRLNQNLWGNLEMTLFSSRYRMGQDTPYQLTERIGEYNSTLKALPSLDQIHWGIHLGIQYLISPTQ